MWRNQTEKNWFLPRIFHRSRSVTQGLAKLLDSTWSLTDRVRRPMKSLIIESPLLWTLHFLPFELSNFSLLDRLVREGNCFICLGLFSSVLISIELSNFHWPFYLFYSLSNFSLNFPTSAQIFQLQPELSNFNLSNFTSDFPTSRFFQLHVPRTWTQVRTNRGQSLP